MQTPCAYIIMPVNGLEEGKFMQCVYTYTHMLVNNSCNNKSVN